jgi:hypothetical protein
MTWRHWLIFIALAAAGMGCSRTPVQRAESLARSLGGRAVFDGGRLFRLELPRSRVRDGDLVVASVTRFAQRRYPDCTVSVQIGYRQGSAWALVRGSAEAGRLLMEEYWEQHADDDSLYEGGAA